MTFLAQGTGEGTVKGRERMGIKEAQGREGKGGKGRGGRRGKGREKEGEGGDVGPLRGKRVERGGEEGKARRNGELTLTHEP